MLHLSPECGEWRALDVRLSGQKGQQCHANVQLLALKLPAIGTWPRQMPSVRAVHILGSVERGFVMATHLRWRLAMVTLYMPYVKVSAQPVASAMDDRPPPGRLRRTLTVGKPPGGGPSCTKFPGVLGPESSVRVQRMEALRGRAQRASIVRARRAARARTSAQRFWLARHAGVSGPTVHRQACGVKCSLPLDQRRRRRRDRRTNGPAKFVNGGPSCERAELERR